MAIDDCWETEMAKAKEESKNKFREMYEGSKNLTPAEVDELITFGFERGPDSVNEQVRRYYLDLKWREPSRAAKMLGDVEPLLQRGIKQVEDVKNLCFTLHTYWSGFVIHHAGETYTVSKNTFRKI